MTHSAVGTTVPVPAGVLPAKLRQLIAGAKANNPLQRVTVVTPGYYSSFYLRRWLAGGGLINVEFLRIEDIADLLAQEKINANSGRPLTRLEGAELVRAAVVECAANGDIPGQLSGLAVQPVLLSALRRTLGQLEAQERAEEISFTRLSAPDEITATVGKVWDAYRRLKREQKLFDRTQVSGWAAEAVRSGVLDDPALQLSVGKLVVLAVAVPAPQYEPLWKAISALSDSALLVCATGDERSDDLLASSFGITPPTGLPDAAPLTEAVTAVDTRSEIAGLIQRIASAASSGVPFNRIAVLYSDSAYATRVRSALTLAGIPVAGPPQKPLSTSPAGRFVKGILSIASTDLARQEVGDWLATCPVKVPRTDSPVTGVNWDRVSKVARVTGGLDAWKRQLGRYSSQMRSRAERIERQGDDELTAGGASAAEAARQESITASKLLEFIQQLSESLSRTGETASWTDWTEWLQRTVAQYLHTPDSSSGKEPVERVATLLERIGNLDMLGSSHPDLSRFSATVIRELSETRSGANKLGKGVFVANVRDAAATQFEHVHILGMADGAFPSRDSADPLLPDNVREQLNVLFDIGLPLSGSRKDLQRHQFLAALMSGNRATLYWSRSSGPGAGEAGPAQWLTEQLRKHTGNESLQASDLLNISAPVTGLSATEYGHGPAHSDVHEYDTASVRNHVELQGRRVQHWLERDTATGVPVALAMERGRYGSAFTPWSGDLSSEANSVPSLSGEVLSASRTESFAGCPLRYFFGYVLNVNPGVRADESLQMAPDRRGTFIHSVLESYLNLRMTDMLPRGKETLETAISVVKADWEKKEPSTGGRVWEFETKEIRRKLFRWLESEKEFEAGGFSPTDAELSFGRKAAARSEQLLPAHELTLEDGTVLTFSGVIDRVDRHPDGRNYVLDYKTGTSRYYSAMKNDPVDRGHHLQLALYSRAVQQFRAPENGVVAGYWFVMDRNQPVIPVADEFDADLADRRLHDVLESLHHISNNGLFPPNPGERSFNPANGVSFENCTYCDFNSVCPAASRRERMSRAHTGDPRLAKYFDLSTASDRGSS